MSGRKKASAVTAVDRKQRIDAHVVLARVLAEGPMSQLSRGEAAALIAAQTMKTNDNIGGTRNRVAMRMDAAWKRGVDADGIGLQRLPNGKFTCDEVARWASRVFAGKVTGLPIASRPKHASASTTIGPKGKMSSIVLPGSIKRCHALIHELYAKVRLLEEAIVNEAAQRRKELASRFKR